MYKGTCLCGAVELEVTDAITDIIHCHCSLCRKSSGTAYATNGFVKSTALKVTKGEDNIALYSFKPGRNRHFCSTCASPLFSSNASDPARVRIRLGILDGDIEERPISHNFITSKANWDNLDDNLPRYEAFEPGRK